MSKKIQITNQEYKILEILYDTYDWSTGMDIISSGKGKVKRTMLYVYLRRLEEKGFIESRELPIEPEIGLRRREYRMVSYGRLFVFMIRIKEKSSDNS